MWPTNVMRIGGLLLIAAVMAIAGLGCGSAPEAEGETRSSLCRP